MSPFCRILGGFELGSDGSQETEGIPCGRKVDPVLEEAVTWTGKGATEIGSVPQAIYMNEQDLGKR